MGRYSRLGKNVALVFMGNAGAKLIGLFMLPFYTSWLTVEDYGTTDIINVYVSFLLGIISCCIADSIFIFPKGQSKKRQKEYFSSGFFFLLSMMFFTGIIFYFIYIYSKVNSITNSFTTNIWLIYGILCSSMFQNMFQQFTRSLDKMMIYSLTGVMLTFFTAFFSFLLIPKFGVLGFVLASVFSNFSTIVFSFLASKSYNFLSFFSVNKCCCIEMLRYSIPLVPNVLMWWFIGALNRPLMEKYMGLHAIGIYAVANKFPSLLTMITGIFGISWQISVLEEYGKNDFEQFYNRIFKYMSLLLVFIFAFITLFSELFVYLFADEDYKEAWHYIPLLTLSVLFANISGLGSNIFSAVRKSKYYFYTSVWGAITALIFNFILIPIWGIGGACVSVVFSFAAMSISRFIYSWQYAKINNIKSYIVMLAICIFILFSGLYPVVWMRSLLILLGILVLLLTNRSVLVELVIAIKVIIKK